MDGPPPPPPPHGENPHTTDGEYRKSSDLPQGNYDIFIVPPHSAGGGFLYLPSLQCNRNSFLAGVASTLLVGLVWTIISPVVRTWYIAAVSNGNSMGIVVVALGVGVAGWAFGMSQSNGFKANNDGNGNTGGGKGFGGGPGPGAGGPNAHGQTSGANYGGGPGQQQYGGAGGSGQQQQQGGNFGGGQHRGNQYAGNQHGSDSPRSEPPPKQDSNNHGPDGAEWEKAREETKRKEELRRKMEEFKRKREAEAKEKERKREREAMEKELKERREQLEKEMAAAREKAEREAREKAQKEAAEARAKAEKEAAEAREKADKEAAEKLAKEIKAATEAKAEAERLAAEAKDKAAKDAAEKEAAAKAQAQKDAMAKFAALKEAAAKRYAEKKAADAKKEKEAGIKPPASAASAPRTPSPKKQPPFPTARTAVEEDDAYSFRPYDRPRRPYGNASGSGSAYSESSYAPSQSTARTTPPPSHRGGYSTKDPDKIVIQGVYQFTNAFNKTPVAQLVSGQGMVTDGLVLRITTEGLFIDDDLRGIGQREWDVKAWTLKLAEVWCPQMGKVPSSKQGSGNPFSFRRGNSVPTTEESDAFQATFLKVCKNTCRLASPAAFFPRSAGASGVSGNGPPQAEFRGLHIFRASVRDQEGKRYVFVVQDTEAWKVALGLQRLRAGALVRALGVSPLPAPECKTILGGLGYI
ncbi:hypothetical protein N7448_003266 [Penicillium atrosanguineum]|uniref:Uncharacterized protein n=1 Tax=Penicillium atrosanguineum TaxID=1132637 RepID=A0A9W9PVN9_9EURO|nr:uncharacterized protein N7443_002238 [Penicillium atrosanguineum]KAJ5139858.1 hypothetical protein N7448_003266 [Penicillium atrosanguineum]KAJ5309777.1 hypothetical protein N7443_002238 [Penicillium atrosanguineum]KAJ5315297.1 hypothetical protein N7476_005604 [Penicillium atrosanguineum]